MVSIDLLSVLPFGLYLASAGLASSWMLLWSAAAAIPIVIHLLNRRKQQTVNWAAMRLLLQVIEKQSKRLRIEQLLLLALRALILIVLAVALARPFIAADSTRGSVALERAPRLWIFTIDDSYSMGYRDDKATRFSEAQRRATELVRDAVRGDAFALITLSQPSRAVISRPSFDRENTLSAIQKLELLDGGADLEGTLNNIKEMIADASKTASLPSSVSVVILSDFGRDTWEDGIGSGRSARLLKELCERHDVVYEPIGGPSPSNVAILDLIPATTRGLKDQPLDVSVTVANFGSSSLMQAPVQLQVEGQTVESQLVDLPAGATRTLNMQLRPSANGMLSFSASLRDDRLPADDQRFAVVEIRDVYRVLCVENSFSDPLILRSALQPQIAANSAIEVTSTTQVELSSLEFDRYDAIVLNDLPSLSDPDYQRLKIFVERGGSAIAFFGVNTDATNWNALLQSDDDLFGFHLTEPSLVDEWRVDPLEYASSIVAPFAAYPDAGLLTTPIFRYWNVHLHASVPKPVIEVALHNGAPWIVRTQHGRGMTASLLSAPQTGSATGGPVAWNAMAAWPSFVPLVQQTVKSTLSYGAASYNLTVGQAISGSAAASRELSQIRVVRPDGTESVTQSSEVNEAGLRSWSFAPTFHRGIYEVKIEAEPSQFFSVNLQPNQSELVAVQLAQLPKSDPSTNETRISATEVIAEPSESLARWLLALLVVLLVGETLLGWHLGRRL